jgi:hypothetical protein
VQLRIVLVGDQDLGDVALGAVSQRHPLVAERFVEVRKARHVG